MSDTEGERYDISGIELDDDHYVVEQALIRNKYKAMGSDGEVVLRAKQKMFKLKEEFPFVDADGNDIFTIKAGSMLDVAGNYVMTDAQSGEDIVILDNDYSWLQDTWKIRDGRDERKLAEINSRGGLVTAARNLLPFGTLIPHKYEITDVDGGHVGTISGQLSLKDTYEITIDDVSDVPKEPVIAAAMVIDAIQGN